MTNKGLNRKIVGKEVPFIEGQHIGPDFQMPSDLSEMAKLVFHIAMCPICRKELLKRGTEKTQPK